MNVAFASVSGLFFDCYSSMSCLCPHPSCFHFRATSLSAHQRSTYGLFSHTDHRLGRCDVSRCYRLFARRCFLAQLRVLGEDCFRFSLMSSDCSRIWTVIHNQIVSQFRTTLVAPFNGTTTYLYLVFPQNIHLDSSGEHCRQPRSETGQRMCLPKWEWDGDSNHQLM